MMTTVVNTEKININVCINEITKADQLVALDAVTGKLTFYI